MRSVLVLLHVSFLVFLKCVNSDNKGNCQITEGGAFDWDLTAISLDDSQVNQELLSAPYSAPLTVDSCTNNDNNFFEVTYNETHFLIRTTKEMEHFDEKTPTKTGFASIHVDCSLTCKGQSTLPIVFQVSDTNGHDPTFINGPYSFVVPSPLMQKTDFTIYGQSVIVEDLDFTNQDVKFTITPEDFEITAKKIESTKKYTAVFAAKKSIQLNGPKTYALTATDTGSNPGTRHSTTSIVLKPDENSSFDTPSFEQPQYSFSYVDGSKNLQPYDASQGSIKVVTNKPNSIEGSMMITGDLQQFLNLKFDPSTLTITLEVKGTTIRTASAFLISTLSVTTDYKATTTIVVYIKSNSQEAPHFSKVLFTGKYQPDTKEVDLDGPIDVLSKSKVDVSVSDGENKDSFSVVSNGDHFAIKVNKPLSQSVIQQQKTILLKLQATSAEGTSFANLAISLPIAPKFDQSSYSIEYDAKKNEVKMNGSISVLTENGKDAILTLKGDYNECFRFEKDSDGYRVNIDKKLPDKVLEEEKAIVLEIIAESTSVESYATLVIRIEGVEDGNGGSDGDDAGRTPYIIAISVMAGLLVTAVIGGTIFYCVKLRKMGSKTADDTEGPGMQSEKVKFNKHSINGPNAERKTSSIADRRPTGFIRGPPEDLDDRGEMDEAKPDSPSSIRERKKSVIFDLNVEEMPIEKIDAASVGNSDVESKSGDDSLDELSDKSDTESMGNVDSEKNAPKDKEVGKLELTQL
ncbi:unnamed protein product [Callosobruchus maculatus]|uniref:Cadherin domain-containing protein n=1 Tax=Callosobruchus maculatus TaxID=64391 RepID=A0A653BMA8_CALMS|nr:unnamed protein product [Callosobruchus maculatus]